ncbi:glycosyltransferase [Actinophytocola algeriensis]|uniref:2-polyprenyl-3-methyl-5-hydroxy-6-metoxy-1, 4-benzoquinol methylase n=1 Tax=Actinophytocola algeriensis TaxID=1768010 RepID=A0A7W7VE14_9PSEU|nr:glycosyltransferase [Actinophytocola algeriensis]MBB4906781.1 2-polyprenyl-3-methyl-5-hydroxy-6-metoxy-1,4-benzoquinol methylase [Actinophytocola algeriensis]MBE1478262.1 2-polyprenyl-3-methyl-5-hydroxy-6-metoxy-1,4-benzoquinol methylase [Actinophytocola algeriensis]
MTIDYADGAESAVLAALRSAHDVSAGSTELSRLVETWETAYHFSPARLGLLAPLRIAPGLRVVDLGCGSGVLSRALGEAGASVLGIEGVPDRAAAAAERCRDLADVRIVQATLADGLAGAAGPFDLAMVCGVLEYNDPAALLPPVVNALSDDGVVVLAIENQLGLRYLLGGVEDHHDKAWVGLADYPGAKRSPRTWTRQALGELLAGAGLTAQRWLFPYPDYKMPRVVLDESAFRHGPELVEKLVRDPLQSSFGGNDGVVSGRIAHRLAMAEGMGVSVAPSFLVVASRSPEALAKVAQPGLAWLISGARRPVWRRTRRVGADHTLQTIHSGLGDSGSWLRQEHVVTEPLHPGRALDACLLDAMRTADHDELTRLFDVWRRTCTARARALEPADLAHPYLPHRDDVPVLPPDHLDVHPGNLIIGPDGSVTRVDLEWHAGQGVDAELVMLRALLEFARETVQGHAPHPWPDRTSVRGVLAELCALTGLTAALEDRWAELVAAEAALQEQVTGHPAARIAAALEHDVDADYGDPLWQLPGGMRRLRADHDAFRAAEHERDTALRREHHLTGELTAHREQVADLTERLAQAEHGLAMTRSEMDLKDDRIGQAFNDLTAAVAEAAAAWQAGERTEAARAALDAETASLRDRLHRTRSRLDALENAKLVRVAHKSLWPAGRLVRGVRDLALGRPGDEPDGLLRKLGQKSPGLTRKLASRYRRSAGSAREAGLHYDFQVPDTLPVGAGQVLELDGWVTHASLGVRAVSMRAGSRHVPGSLGHHRPDVAAALRPGGVRVPDGSGVSFRIPVAGADAPGRLALTLVVELVDGTTLTRQLPTVELAPANLAPSAVRWPSDGAKVAICMATYRPDPDFLAHQLDSIRAQKHPNWVCVIADDASGDEHVATIRRLVDGDDRFVVLAHDENVGFYRNFERAMTHVPADAQFVALSDQDDVWDADKLDTLLERFDDPAVTLAYADMRLIDEHDEVVASSFWRHRHNQWTDLDALLLLNTVTGAAAMVRADVVRDLVLPFPPGTPSAFHDQWIAATAMAAGRLEFVDRPLHSYRQHGGAITGRRDNRLDDGLPTGLGWLGLAMGARRDDAELEAVAEYELRRVAQFTTVLLMRTWHRLGDVREKLAELTRVERDLTPLVRRARADRQETAGAERRLLAAAVRWKSLRGKRLRIPVLPPHPVD